MNTVIKFVGTVVILLTSFAITSAQHNTNAFRQRIEDLRRVLILDVLNLQGDQVQTFFAVYAKAQEKVLTSKENLMEATTRLKVAIEQKVSDSELQVLTTEVLEKTKAFEDAVHSRITNIRSILNVQQLAKYVVFETNFQEELQKKILQRVRPQQD
ncbi:MAG: hypothetical protein HQ472_02685 [Ignavibacteria bacterium]|nr:hypothetical protein [Ignavibacteria bacterium]